MNPEDINNPIAGGVIGFLTWAVLWFRSERVRNAKAKKEIAGAERDATINEGQREEFERLQAAVAQLQPLAHRVAVLEAKLAGVAVLCEMLLLCDDCSSKNSRLIEKIQVALAGEVKL